MKLYGKLKEQKYEGEMAREQRQKAAKELEKKIKRMVRDEPEKIKELPWFTTLINKVLISI